MFTSVEDIKKMYFDLGGKIFAKKYKWWNVFQLDELIKASYDAGPRPLIKDGAGSRVGSVRPLAFCSPFLHTPRP